MKAEYLLRYFRDLDQREVDFVICEGRHIYLFAEAKLSATSVDKNLVYIKKKFRSTPCFQVHLRGEKEFINAEGVCVLHIKNFISEVLNILEPERAKRRSVAMDQSND